MYGVKIYDYSDENRVFINYENGFETYEAAEDYGFSETCSNDALDYEIIEYSKGVTK